MPSPGIAGPGACVLMARLLDAHERGCAMHTYRVRVGSLQGGLDAREALEHDLLEAQALGAIRIVRGVGGTRHLVEHIRLADPVVLAGLLGRQPRAMAIQANLGALDAGLPTLCHALTRQAYQEVRQGWAENTMGHGFAPGDANASSYLRALDAVLLRAPDDTRDLRTLSRATLGNSKLLEDHLARIARYLVSQDLVEAGTTQEVAHRLGLEKFAQPVLVSGSVMAGGCDISGLVYAGLPPEALDDIVPLQPIRSLLTIENLASYNRHVRTARRPGDIVVYTGGFPSRSVQRAITVLAAHCPQAVYHWGDMDPHGVMIALEVTRAAGVEVRPHLMRVVDAQSRGGSRTLEPAQTARPHPSILGIGTPFEDLGRYLACEGAYHVEQEEFDPVPVQP